MARITTLVRPTESTRADRADVRAPFGGGGAAERSAVGRHAATGQPALGQPALGQATQQRVRGSLLATLSLLVGAAAALVVLTGVLASPGVALGGLGTILAIGGLSASRKRTIAGRVDALLGLALALGAVVVGVLAFTGALPWPNPDANHVGTLRDWLDGQTPWLFPS